jgi:hypothetical protein
MAYLGFTNRGKYLLVQAVFFGAALPTTFRMALCTSATAPSDTTNVITDLTQITDGTGYTTLTTSAGKGVARSVSGFITGTEDDTNHLAKIVLQDLVWTASGGSISGISYLALCDDAATPNVWAYATVTGGPATVTTGQTFTIQGFELQFISTLT